MIKKIILGISCMMMFTVAAVSLAPVYTFASAPNGFGDDSQVKEKPFNIPKADKGKQWEALLDVIKGVVNWVLGILGLIALIVVLYGGFLMVTAGGDSGQYDNGLKFLKGALLGIAVIGLAWFIASIVFWLISLTTTEAWTSAGTES